MLLPFPPRTGIPSHIMFSTIEFLCMLPIKYRSTLENNYILILYIQKRKSSGESNIDTWKNEIIFF